MRRKAVQFIIFLGIVSLFGDITYEGARSINGQFLAVLGASAFVVGTVAGFGELLGYCIRLFSGYFTDKTHKYWGITFFGYILNQLAVPLLALAGNWYIAALLIILERFGKGIRTPARDAMLSFAAKETGRGWGFGLHRSLDQIGAVSGPLIMAAVLYYKHNFHYSYALLGISAFFCVAMLVLSRISFPSPEKLEAQSIKLKTKGFTKHYWLYVFASALVAAGYADFALIAYHFHKSVIMADLWIPVLYSIAMGMEGVSSLLLGRVLDLKGIPGIVIFIGISSLFAPLVFFGGFYTAIAGMIVWGLGMGIQESVMRAVVANLVPKEKRGSGYGVFNMIFGVFWFLGSALMGALYDISAIYIVLFSMIVQFLSIPLMIRVKTSSGF